MRKRKGTRSSPAVVTDSAGAASGAGGVAAPERAPSASPVGAGAGVAASGSVYATPFGTGELIPPIQPVFLPTPYGQSVMIVRSRVAPDDEIQMHVQPWTHITFGYQHNGGGSTPSMNPEITDLTELIADIYPYLRKMGEVSVKYRHTPTTITAGLFEQRMDYYHDAVANTALMLNLLRLKVFNSAVSNGIFTSSSPLETNAQLWKSLWRRLMAIRHPAELKLRAIRDGTPVYDVRHNAVWCRVWHFDGNTRSAPAGWVSLVTANPQALLMSGTEQNNLLYNMRRLVHCLEGTLAYGVGTLDEGIALCDLFEMLSYVDQFKEFYPQGLPSEDALPGIVADESGLNDFLCRAFTLWDTKGAGADNKMVFPVADDPNNGFGAKIPVMGYGAPQKDDFNLFGAVKFGALANTTGLIYAADSDVSSLYGTAFPCAPTASTQDLAFKSREAVWTREDGWVVLESNATDFGDGTAIRTFVSGGHYRNFHEWNALRFAAQWAGTFEYRMLTGARPDWIFWTPARDLVLNHAMEIARLYGIPYKR